MEKEKVINYTAEQTTELVEAYKAAPTAETVEAFASKFGKKGRSIIAKLVREGVYQAKVYVSKTGAPVVHKDDTATEIGELLGLTENDAASLAKANKAALLAVRAALKVKASELATAMKTAE